jgi:hypothetical protein
MIVACRKCEDVTPHRHLHDTAHGVAGTHMEGTERFVCSECGCTTYAFNNPGTFTFTLDKAAS